MINSKRYIPPPDHPLHPHLQSIWSGYAEKPFRRETILPKGNVDIIFSLAEPPRLLQGKGLREPLAMRSCMVHGVQTGALQNEPGKEFKLIGISLTMEGCATILPLPACEVTDLRVEGNLIFDDTEILLEQLYEITDFNRQCRLLIDWLCKLIKPTTKHKLIRYACDRMRQTPTERNLPDIAKSLGMSERHLRRLFSQQVGLTPARYLRMSRFIKTIYLMPTTQSLTQIAHHAYYTDQAHFCRDFKDIAGMTPKEYRQGVDNVPGHIFTN